MEKKAMSTNDRKLYESRSDWFVAQFEMDGRIRAAMEVIESVHVDISRFSRNTLIALSTIKKLKAKHVGIYFESEGVYSLNEDTAINREEELAFNAVIFFRFIVGYIHHFRELVD